MPRETQPNGDAVRPLVHVRRRPDGRFDAWVGVGTFESEDEARQAAENLAVETGKYFGVRQLVSEVAQGRALGSESLDQQEDRFLRDLCNGMATDLKTVELWDESQQWPDFKKAWDSWKSAWNGWVAGRQRFPEMRGKSTTRYQHLKKVFLAGLKQGRGNKKEFWQNHRWVLFAAATLGDVDFFRRIRQHKGGRVDPRMFQVWLLMAWMPAALWTSTAAAAGIFLKRNKAWGDFPPSSPESSVRVLRSQLRLWHSRKPRIIGWTEGGHPSANPESPAAPCD